MRMNWKAVALVALLVGIAAGVGLGQANNGNSQQQLFWAFERQVSPEMMRAGVAPPPTSVGQYQAVPDGAGGLFIIDTIDTSIIKHVVKTPQGYAVEYMMPGGVPAPAGRGRR